MMCFWTASSSYLIEKIRNELNVHLGTSSMRLEFGNLDLNIGRKMNKL